MEFNNFNEITKKQVFEAILDKIASLDWQEVEAHKQFFEFLGSSLKMETRTILQEELFGDVASQNLNN